MIQLSALKRLCALTVIGLSVTGCTTLNNLGNSVWSGTEKVASTSYDKVASLFRTAPKTDTGGLYVGSDATLNSAILARRLVTQANVYNYRPKSTRPEERLLHVQPRPQLRGQYSVPRSHIVMDKTHMGNVAKTPTPIYQGYEAFEQNEVPMTQQNEEPGLSYVRVAGGVSMADFEKCAQAAGGYFEQTQTGYIPNKGFDRCMRQKGYMSEDEAEARFALIESSSQYRNGFAP